MADPQDTPNPPATEGAQLEAQYRLGLLRQKCREELLAHLDAVAMYGASDRLEAHLHDLQQARRRAAAP